MTTVGTKVASQALPAPVGGLNTRDLLFDMPPTDALVLENWFPEGTSLSLRPGYRQHSSGGSSTASVRTVIEYVTATGSAQLLKCYDNSIYDATPGGSSSTALKTTGITSDLWQYVTFRGKLILVNGADIPQQYDGSSMTDATYTGVTSTDLIQVSSFGSRLWFVQKNTMSGWYGGVNNITGALTEFDFGSYFKLGGYLVLFTSLSVQNNGLVDYFVAVSSQGEIIMFQGDYPGGTWSKVGHVVTGPPLGRRSALQYGQDVILLTRRGVMSLASLLAAKDMGSPDLPLSSKIDRTWKEYVQAAAGNSGWEMVVYPQKRMGIINVPVVASSLYHQLVINLETGAWTKFTGIPSYCWCSYLNKPYFGTTLGQTCEFDFGYSDSGRAIETDMKQAFTYFGDRTTKKRLTLLKPIVQSDTTFTIQLAADSDYKDSATFGGVEIAESSGSAWDSATWDTSTWATDDAYIEQWQSVSALGKTFAIKARGDFRDVSVTLAAWEVQFEPGGYL